MNTLLRNDIQTLFIFEPVATGHNMVYVRRIARQATRQGISTTVLTMPKSLDSESYKVIREELGDGIKSACLRPNRLTLRLIQSNKLVLMQLGYYGAVSDFFRKLNPAQRPDFVFVPFIDHINHAIALFGSPFQGIPFGGLCMIYKFHYGKMGAIRPPSRDDRLKELSLQGLLRCRHLTSLFTIDELLYEYVRYGYPRLFPKLKYVGDPVDMDGNCSKKDARLRYGLRDDDVVILLYGGLLLRKGVVELVNASKHANFPANVTFLFVGQQDVDVRSFLSGDQARLLRSRGRLVEQDAYVSDEEEFAAFRASDIVWIGYKDFYQMSGVLVQAGKMSLPVISSPNGLAGWLVKKYELGITSDINNVNEIVSGVISLATDHLARERYGTNGSDFARDHSSQFFAESIVKAIQIDFSTFSPKKDFQGPLRIGDA